MTTFASLAAPTAVDPQETLRSVIRTVTLDASRGDYFHVVLRGDGMLAAPENGGDGQRILVEVLGADADRTLSLDPSILLPAGIAVPVTIPAGRRWFAWLISMGGAGWILGAAATQA